MDVTVRKPRLEERDVVEEQILEYLKSLMGLCHTMIKVLQMI